MKRAILILCLLALSSCWMGTDFYRVRPLAIIPAGEYLQHEPGNATPLRLRVQPLRNGTTLVTNLSDSEAGDKSMTISFYPLARTRGRYVAKMTRMDGKDLPRNRIAYGLAAPDADGSFRIIVPICGDTSDLAERHGAQVVHDDPAFGFCIFRSRQRLEAALRELQFRPGEFRRLVPVRPAPQGG